MKKKWEPYELESFGFGSPADFKKSRETLLIKLRIFERQVEKIAAWVKENIDANGGKLF